MITTDQKLELPTEGNGDWDSSLNGNFSLLERGYHTVARAGMAVSTADVLWMSSGGFFYRFNPNSEDIYAHAIAPIAASSGESVQVLLAGIVRSVGLTIVPGREYFVAANSPGLVVGSYSAATRRIGFGVDAGGLYFNPRRSKLETLTRVNTITINPTSEHLFSMDLGNRGWVRDLMLKSNSADKVGLAFYTNSARTNLLYQTISGGVTTATSFVDRAGWPYDNTDASTLNGLVYGRVWPDSGALIASQDLQIRVVGERWI